MAEVSQYKFDLQEVAKLLLEKEAIHHGRWKIGVNFSIGAVEAGPTPDKVSPGMVVSVDQFLLTAVGKNEAGPLIVDAQKRE